MKKIMLLALVAMAASNGAWAENTNTFSISSWAEVGYWFITDDVSSLPENQRARVKFYVYHNGISLDTPGSTGEWQEIGVGIVPIKSSTAKNLLGGGIRLGSKITKGYNGEDISRLVVVPSAVFEYESQPSIGKFILKDEVFLDNKGFQGNSVIGQVFLWPGSFRVEASGLYNITNEFSEENITIPQSTYSEGRFRIGWAFMNDGAVAQGFDGLELGGQATFTQYEAIDFWRATATPGGGAYIRVSLFKNKFWVEGFFEHINIIDRDLRPGGRETNRSEDRIGIYLGTVIGASDSPFKLP